MKLQDILIEASLNLEMINPMQRAVLKKLAVADPNAEDGSEGLSDNEKAVAHQLIDMGLVDEYTYTLTDSGQEIASKLGQMVGGKLDNPLATKADSFNQEFDATVGDEADDPIYRELNF